MSEWERFKPGKGSLFNFYSLGENSVENVIGNWDFNNLGSSQSYSEECLDRECWW